MTEKEPPATTEENAVIGDHDVQETPAFFEENILDEGFERRKPTPKEVESMDKQMIGLGKLFADSGVNWQLDGARNISLMRGEYIGVHKDIDITIAAEDLEKLDEHLKRQQYGLFFSRQHPDDPRGKRIMKRATAQQCREAGDFEHLMVMATDEQGKIRRDTSLNFIDVHIVKKDDQGKIVGWGDAPLPQEWYEPQKINFHGQAINLSHPAKVAYFKLHDTRSYDAKDLQRLAETGRVTKTDIIQIREVLEKVHQARLETANRILDDACSRIKSGMREDQVYEAFLQNPIIARRLEWDEQAKTRIKNLGARIVQQSADTKEAKKLAFQEFPLEKELAEKLTRLEKFANYISSIRCVT